MGDEILLRFGKMTRGVSDRRELPMTNALPDHAQQWNEYRRRRIWYIAMFPFILAMLFAQDYVKSWALHFLLTCVWLIPYFWSLEQLGSWPCPRCGKSFVCRSGFYWRGIVYWFGAGPTFCWNCGLPKFGDPAVDPPTPKQVVA
jgi:hypothetical protein